jgi:hypothetical protein
MKDEKKDMTNMGKNCFKAFQNISPSLSLSFFQQSILRFFELTDTPNLTFLPRLPFQTQASKTEVSNLSDKKRIVFFKIRHIQKFVADQE